LLLHRLLLLQIGNLRGLLRICILLICGFRAIVMSGRIGYSTYGSCP
jgi:hypothetical protein